MAWTARVSAALGLGLARRVENVGESKRVRTRATKAFSPSSGSRPAIFRWICQHKNTALKLAEK